MGRKTKMAIKEGETKMTREVRQIENTPYTLEVMWTDEATPMFKDAELVRWHLSQGISVKIIPAFIPHLIMALQKLQLDVTTQTHTKRRKQK